MADWWHDDAPGLVYEGDAQGRKPPVQLRQLMRRLALIKLDVASFGQGQHGNAEPRCSARTEAYHSSGRLPDLLPLAAHAGAGGARSRAISDRMSANICCGTATSANWNVM